MKMRNGFVSNSSSSSFILGYGVIKGFNTFDKIKKFLDDNDIEYSFIDDYGDKCGYDDVNLFARSIQTDERILTGGNDTELIIPREVAEGYNQDGFITVEIRNDEGDGGDGGFTYNELTGDMDYEKAKHIEYYPERQQKLINLLKDKTLFSESKVVLGAERNG